MNDTSQILEDVQLSSSQLSIDTGPIISLVSRFLCIKIKAFSKLGICVGNLEYRQMHHVLKMGSRIV